MPERRDEFVQATNNSSIVSKRSVEKLYGSILYPSHPEGTQYFHHFVPKFKRRSPVINRGYLLRLLIVRQTLDKLLQASGDDKVYVINLGCGYDPIAFEYLEKPGIKDKVVFVDIDYHALIDEKFRMIHNSPELKRIIKLEDESTSCHEFMALKNKSPIYKIVTDNYIMVQCDLNDDKSYQSVLQDLNLLGNQSSSTKIFIAEVSITYMEPDKSDKIIEHSTQCGNSHFIILEQLIPNEDMDDRFVQLMFRHFNKVNSPIRSVEGRYRTFEHQQERYHRLANHTGELEMVTLMEYWDHFISDELKQKISKVEGFDEYEEHNLFCTHYYFGHFTNNGRKVLQIPAKPDLSKIPIVKAGDLGISFQVQEIANLQRRLTSACAFPTNKDTSILVNSGFSQAKLSSSLILSNDNSTLPIKGITPPERLCHSIVSINDSNKFLLIGGRSAPNKPFTDCWILEPVGDVYQWRQTASLPDHGRYRMNAFVVGQDVIVCNGSIIDNCFLKFDTTTESWEKLALLETGVESFLPRVGAAVTYNSHSNKGYIFGGMFDENTIDPSIYEFQLNMPSNEVKITKIMTHAFAGRFGAAVTSIGKSSNQYLLFGGVATDFVYGQDTAFVIFDAEQQKFTKLQVEKSVWEKFPIFVCGDLVDIDDGQKIYVGGGAVCYSFGSYWNGLVKINIGSDQSQSSTHNIFEFLNKENKIDTERKPDDETSKTSVSKDLKSVTKKPTLVKSKAIEKVDGKSIDTKEIIASDVPLVITATLSSPSSSSSSSSCSDKVMLQNIIGQIGATTEIQVSNLLVKFSDFIDGMLVNKYQKQNVSIQLDDDDFLASCFELSTQDFGNKKTLVITSGKLTTPLMMVSSNLQIMVQLRGQRLVKLYPGSQRLMLVGDSNELSTIHDIFNRNPKLEFNVNPQLTPFETIVNEGDVIIVPSGWIVGQRSLDTSIMINYEL